MTDKTNEPTQIEMVPKVTTDMSFHQDVRRAFDAGYKVNVICKMSPVEAWIMDVNDLAMETFQSRKKDYDTRTQGKTDLSGITFPYPTTGTEPEWPIKYYFDTGLEIKILDGKMEWEGEDPYLN